jgi:hypothetical protein
MERRKRPINYARGVPVLDGIDMNVVHVRREIRFVANEMFPVAPLSDAALASADACCRARLRPRNALGKFEFDQSPARGEIGVARGKGNDAMQMVRQYDPTVYREWVAHAHLCNRPAEQIDMSHEQIVSVTTEQVHGEEPRPAGLPCASIVRHVIDCLGKRVVAQCVAAQCVAARYPAAQCAALIAPYMPCSSYFHE